MKQEERYKRFLEKIQDYVVLNLAKKQDSILIEISEMISEALKPIKNN